MKEAQMKHPEKISSYFYLARIPLVIITITGILYNVGMVAGPYFEGLLAQRLYDIMQQKAAPISMLSLVITYVLTILFVQTMRYIKRFYVRRFANDTNRRMRHMLYNNLLFLPEEELQKDSIGNMMTKSVIDVDACAEGMRKFTTEIFDTGVVLISYLIMLVCYDWKLTLLSCCATPLAYICAEKLKKVVYRYTSAAKESTSRLNNATLDRLQNALLYRVYGREERQNAAYETYLSDYEHNTVHANIWENTMPPLYQIISMTGVISIIYFGAKNISGNGWTTWNIAAFTTFLSCFGKLALKSSKAAKLFHAVQKAQVSWKRIKPFMKPYQTLDTTNSISKDADASLTLSHVSFAYPDGNKLLKDISFTASPGTIVGITGSVACGKSTLGKLFLNVLPYQGTITYGLQDIAHFSPYELSQLVSYMGHQPMLMSTSIAENISLGDTAPVEPFLHIVCLEQEINDMPQGINTILGSGGVRLSGGQQARVALARTLYHKTPILVLDDPFSAVDQKTEAQILEQMKTYTKDCIVLIISHRLTHFPAFDQVIYLENGKAYSGTHEEMLKMQPEYLQLYTKQMGGDFCD